MKRVTAIGGIFFKSQNPAKLREWYKTHLGIESNEWGGMVEWQPIPGSTEAPYTLWTPFTDKTKYFEPSTKEFMINYRVEDLSALVEELKKEGITFLDELSDSEYGKFIHLLDPEGNKLELWEPAKEA